jgi:hypothetical protein
VGTLGRRLRGRPVAAPVGGADGIPGAVVALVRKDHQPRGSGSDHTPGRSKIKMKTLGDSAEEIFTADLCYDTFLKPNNFRYMKQSSACLAQMRRPARECTVCPEKSNYFCAKCEVAALGTTQVINLLSLSARSDIFHPEARFFLRESKGDQSGIKHPGVNNSFDDVDIRQGPR